MGRPQQNIDSSDSDKGEVITERQDTPPDSIMNLRQVLKGLETSLYAWIFFLVLNFLMAVWPIGIAALIAYIVFLVYIGRVSQRLNKNPVIWVGLSVIIPFFCWYAYIHLSKRAKALLARYNWQDL